MAYALKIVLEQRIDACRDERGRKEPDPHKGHSVSSGSISEKETRGIGRCKLYDEHQGCGDRECISDEV